MPGWPGLKVLSRRALRRIVGDGEQVQTHGNEATELADESWDEELARRLNTLPHLASADLYLDRFPAATRHA